MLPIIGEAINKAFGVVDKLVPDNAKNAELKAELEKALINEKVGFVAQEANIITAEAKGESFLQRNWRPITMLVFVYIVFNNFILSPYVKCFYPEFPILPVPNDLWDLLKIGLGGYIVGRSVEKVAVAVKK
jgi:hypothetical protein